MEKEKEYEYIRLPMECSCGDGLAECDELYEQVKVWLGGPTPSLLQREITDKNFLDNIVVSLEWDYSASIEGIYCDQWCGVSVKESKYSHDKPVSVYVECDHVHHGLAAIYKWFYENRNMIEK